MKIALVIKSLIIAKGGAERFSQNLIRGLLSKEHKITVFCHDWDATAEKLNVDFIKISEPGKFIHPWVDFSTKVQKAISKAGSFDAVFGLTQLCPQKVHRLGGGVYKYWYKRKYGKLFRLQLLRSRVRKALAFERKMYSPENIQQIITISEMDKKILMEYYKIPAEKIHTVYNGFDMEVFLATKNPENFSLVIIGKSRNSVQKKLKKTIHNNFKTVWLDRVENPADFYRGADFMLFPTLYDSFANVIGEALLGGLPVITTAQAGGAEMVIHKKNGFVASDANAISELTSFIEKLADKKTCKEFSECTGEKVSKLTIDYCAAQTEKILLM